MDDYTLAGNVQQQRTVKAQCQPQGIVTRSRNIKHPVQYRHIVAGGVPHAEPACQVIIGAFLFRPVLREMKKTEFLQMLARQIIRMNEPEDFFFPDGRKPAFFPVPVHPQCLRKPSIIDITCIVPHIAQYGNGIFHPCIVAGYRLWLYIAPAIRHKALLRKNPARKIPCSTCLSSSYQRTKWLFIVIVHPVIRRYLCKVI